MVYVITCIIIAILYLIWSYRSHESQLMRGFWRADAQFCDNAELTMFVLYLGDNSSWIGNSRYGYILASNEQGVILNHPVQLTFSGSYCVEPYLSSSRCYNVSAEWLDEEADPDTFPSDFKASYYPKNGKLVLYSNDQVLATLWKDQQMSALGCGDLCPKEVVDNEDISDEE